MRRGIIASLFTMAVGVSACAYYNDHAHASPGGFGLYRYQGGAYAGIEPAAHFTGTGAELLDPWLASTREGRRLVSTRFDARRDGRISAETAHHANLRFGRYADTDRDLQLTDEEIRRALMAAGRSAAF